VVSGVVERLRGWGASLAGESPGQGESVTFSLPRDLQA